MRACIHAIVTAFAAIALISCGGGNAMDEQLRADLDAASAGGIELAPMGTGTNVVSGVEQAPHTQVRPATPRPQAPPTRRQPRRSPDRAPVEEPQVVDHAPVSNEPAAIRPSSAPAVQPAPPGGYKTVDEVIRNAPFPIKP